MITMSQLYESKPEHPDTIVIKNKFYPKGLTQENIYDYYISRKSNLLKEVKDREIMIFFCTDVNTFVVKRKDPLGGFFKLNEQNYNKIISGRTISIHSTMNSEESFGIIDVDAIDFKKGKSATQEIYDHLVQENKNIKIRFTGKDSFHIIYNFQENKNINEIRIFLTKLLEPFSKKFHIGTGQRRKVGLDLSPNKNGGGFITLHSLSIEGLRCMEVSRSKLETFKKEDAIINIRSELYHPPYNTEYLKDNYPQLLKDPIHKWRAETGIELIHKEPTKKELMRIWKNWNLMTPEMKTLSDKKSIELFGINNQQNYNDLISQYKN